MTNQEKEAARKRLWDAICGHRLKGPEEYARILNSGGKATKHDGREGRRRGDETRAHRPSATWEKNNRQYRTEYHRSLKCKTL